MTATYVEAIPLSEAIYCAGCECITHIHNGKCANCDSTAVEFLRRWLNREEKP